VRLAIYTRLLLARRLVARRTGATLAEIASDVGVSKRTALRYLQALEAAGEPLWHYADGHARRWRLTDSGRPDP
jgi:predicted DNA-binding transcriptional regulator YafY